ncbi:DNA-binding protein Rfx5 [Caerostris extrusa]|uniref:DNA-binding protein Rfx5 n=1 Tax=Caerostris extrusa TaxID=172846 RepID=A0AAV4NTC4_CAEEX|nr:DNA-binding protein Rfx5 [Caerostris extrusa]
MENNNHKSTSNGAEMISSLTHSDLSNKMISELILKSGLTGNYMESCLPSEDNRAVKRHLNEKTSFNTRTIHPVKRNEEEVSVHDIEGDALNDYFRGVGASVSSFPTLHPMKKKDESESRQLTCNKNKVKQLSQLRMLLEQNLPKRITSISSLSSSKEDLAPIVSSVVTQNTQISSQSSDPAVVKNQLPSEIHATHLNTQQFDLNNLCSSELMPSTIDKLNSNNSQFSVIEKLNTSNSQFNVINKLNTSNSQFNVISKLHASNSQFNAFDKPLIDLCSNENNNMSGTTEISILMSF